jgi:hypothetical protein
MSVNPTRAQILRNDRVEYDERPVANPKREMEEVFAAYLATNPAFPKKRKNAELEVRFQGINGQPLTKIDYDNVIQHLYAAGFTPENPEGIHMLRIQPEYTNARDGKPHLSNIRAEIVGVDLIQEYCATNSIQHLIHLSSTMSARSEKVLFTQKTPVKKDPDNQTSDIWRPVDFRDHNFRVGYQEEQIYGPNNGLVRDMIETKRWADSKKVFRHLNRVRFTHPSLPIFADISILRSSIKMGKVMIPHYTIQEAKVFEEPESYEVELEIDNRVWSMGSPIIASELKVALDILLTSVRSTIRVVLSAIQGTNYPITNSEMRQIQHAYLRTVYGQSYDTQNHRVAGKDFIGPSSKTLQIENLIPESKTSSSTTCNTIRICEGYTVTDKADGERKMMYIADGGKIYLIDSTMRVQFTGTTTSEKRLYGSLFDGEHIKYDKHHHFINLYAVFDVYYVHNKSVRELPFMLPNDVDLDLTKHAHEKDAQAAHKTRWYIMSSVLQLLKPHSITDKLEKSDSSKVDTSCPLRIQCKQFYVADSHESIFAKCATILANVDDGIFEYETDGLIFTPAKYGVGGGENVAVGPLRKFTWEESFKWKPAEFNTIDFLVRLQKDETGKDKVFVDYKDGQQFDKMDNVLQYKQLVLHCGFDKKRHEFMNPFQQLIDGDYQRNCNEIQESDQESTYLAKPFVPSNPYDEKAFLCNVEIKTYGDGTKMIQTEEHEAFDENMIVEFRYDIAKAGGWRWIPLRVRYDKTAQMRQRGNRVFGNDYTTADSNWYSIHHPITKRMITTGRGIPEQSTMGEDVYYSRRTSDTTTRGLRDFHNMYVKSKLITGTANRKDTLIDFSVGKAGDLAKWRSANVGFVFGIDISKDNIVNKVDGACARYLRDAAKYRDLFGAIFIAGNSATNIRNGDAFGHQFKEKRIVQAIFGEGAKNRQELGEGVYRNYGVARDGFHVSSCQFSLHYFFENSTTLHHFVRNVAECTRVGGTFIGTCWDGETVFRLLKSKQKDESFTIMRGGSVMFQLTKLYDETGFPEDEMSLGYGVNVYQESIGKAFTEYLVNFKFLVRIMENYGFVLATNEETVKMGLPGGSAMFDAMYYNMESEAQQSSDLKQKYWDALHMSEEEKTVSFLNRYFMFRKVRHVATERVTQLLESNEEMGKPEDIEIITQKINKRKKLADKENPAAAIVATKKRALRPIKTKDTTTTVKMVIGSYDPIPEEVEEVSIENIQVTEEDDEPVIQLAPPIPTPVVKPPKKIRVPKLNKKT